MDQKIHERLIKEYYRQDTEFFNRKRKNGKICYQESTELKEADKINAFPGKHFVNKKFRE